MWHGWRRYVTGGGIEVSKPYTWSTPALIASCLCKFSTIAPMSFLPAAINLAKMFMDSLAEHVRMN